MRNICLLLSLYCASVAYAQQPQPTAVVPKLVRFSGSFRPADGTPAQTMESVTLSVYRDRTGGDSLWHEIQNVIVEADGHYSVLMGATQSEGMPLDLFASGEPRWLGAQFNRPGEAEQPRVLLVSVPYALKAADAETLGGRPASAYLLAGAPAANRTAADPVETSAPATITENPTKATPLVTPATLPNFITKFNSTLALVDSVIYEAPPGNAFAGNVGVGTMSPGSKLDVAGGVNFTTEVRYRGLDVLKFPGSDVFIGNVALGEGALNTNPTGIQNTALGLSALEQTTGGTGNMASGYRALGRNTLGNFNTAFGLVALGGNITGSNNIAVGALAAFNVAGGSSNNIHIGSQGSSGDSGTIRIGDTSTQSAFFAAGVRGITTGNNDAIPVMVDSLGQLGTVSSSRRFKEDIEDMGAASHDLMRLRPVTFRYKQPFGDGSKPIQYGLIAEEVAEVFPDLVAHSADGQIETVKYQVLDSMLLNEVQRQQAEIRRLEQKIKEQDQTFQARLARLEAALALSSGESRGPSTH